MTDYAEFRLPRTVEPSHYDLLIHSDLQARRFSGVVTTSLKVTDPKGVSELVFNAGPKLHLGKALVVCEQLKTESKQVIDKVDVDAKRERASIKLATALPAGAEVKLTVAFEAELDGSMMGYYLTTSEHNGKKIVSALTQFEPTSQRRAFPGWDEPDLKTTVTFKMIHRKESTALANMPVEKETSVSHADIDKLLRVAEFGVPAPYNAGQAGAAGKTEGKTEVSASAAAGKTEGKTEISSSSAGADDAWVLTEFSTTPKLSTYLIAWAEGPFKKLSSSFKSPKSGREVAVNVYATEDFIDQAHYTVEVTKKVVPVYEQVFDIEYPLPKVDTLVAADFDAGAMENWGLITGRTSVYLYDPKKSGIAGQKRTAGVQSHEVAHQWFGNLVTMRFWDNLWLNEAFATLMGEVIILDKCFPEWDSASEFIAMHLERALELDAKRSSHAIEVRLSSESGDLESAINQIFDAVSYSKGASVLRMLSKLVGEDVFLKGVSIYLKKLAYGNSVTADLWNGIRESSGKDVPRIMKNWILQQGFPVLTVTEEADSIKVRQNRFLTTGDVKPEEDETLWYIPLAIKNSQGVDMDAVLDEKREAEFPVKDAKNSIWKLNGNTIGVYRVAYTPERLAKLGKEAANKNGVFSLEDRVGLISDAFTLAKAGFGKTSGGLDLLKGFNLGEDRYLANLGAATHTGSMSSVWWEQPKEVRDAIDAFRADLFGPAVKKLGFDFAEDDSPDLRQLRTTVIGAAAAAGDEYTLQEIKRRVAPLVESGDESLIHPDILRTCITHAVKHGGVKEWEAVLALYRKAPTPTHKIAALLALGATKDEELIKRTFEWVFDGDEVKTQDYMYPIMALSSNVATRRQLRDTVLERHAALVKRFEGNFSLGRIIEYSINSFTSKEDLSAIEAFFADKDNSKYASSLKQALDAVRANTSWVSRDAEDVKQWLAKAGYLKA
ncbi:unnamed protein product [Parajaminaea phylloscopi]